MRWLVGRLATGIDVRRAGSGNVGAANVLRTSGVAMAVCVLLLDMAKGAASVLWVARLTPGESGPALAGLAAVVGHVYPVWLRFRGGKGVATAAGVFSVLTPLAIGPAAVVFVLTVWSTRYISLGSILATLALESAGVDHRRLVCRHGHGRGRRRVDRVPAPLQHRPPARRVGASHRPAGHVMRQVAILGAGSFGTALAGASGAGRPSRAAVGPRCRRWPPRSTRRRENAVYLPGVELPPSVTATGDLGEALAGSELIIVAVPSHGLRHVMVAARPHLPAAATIVSTTKGLEEGTLAAHVGAAGRGRRRLLPVAVLSGPSFASEVAKGLPTAVVVAAADARTVALVQDEFRGRYLRLVRQRGRGRRRDRRRA